MNPNSFDPFLTRENADYLLRTHARRGESPPPSATLVRRRMREVLARDVGGSAAAATNGRGTDRRTTGDEITTERRGERLQRLNRSVLEALHNENGRARREGMSGPDPDQDQDAASFGAQPPTLYREDETVLVINARDRDWADTEPSPHDICVRLDTPNGGYGGGPRNAGVVLRHGAIRDVVAVRPTAAYVPRAAVDAPGYAYPFVVLGTDAPSTNRVVASAPALNGPSVVLARDASAGSTSHAGFVTASADGPAAVLTTHRAQQRLASIRLRLLGPDGTVLPSPAPGAGGVFHKIRGARLVVVAVDDGGGGGAEMSWAFGVPDGDATAIAGAAAASLEFDFEIAPTITATGDAVRYSDPRLRSSLGRSAVDGGGGAAGPGSPPAVTTAAARLPAHFRDWVLGRAGGAVAVCERIRRIVSIDTLDEDDVVDTVDLGWLSLRPATPVDPHLLVRVTGRVADHATVDRDT
jgi:hypothetical protein